MTKATAGAVREPELLPVMMRRSVSWSAGASIPREYLAGYRAHVERATAAAFVLLEYAEPEGWAPTPADLAAAARTAFEGLEAERGGRTPSDLSRIPSFVRRYRRVLEILTAAEGPQEAA